MTLPVDYANATVSLDTHPDAHNATNAAVNDLETRVTTIEDTPPPAGGSIILDGAGAPSTGLGAVDDYYLDTTNRVLYGPKSATGPAQSISVAGTPTSQFGNMTHGVRVQFGVAGVVNQVRYQRAAANNATLTIKAWNTATTALITSIDDTQSAGVGWFTVTLPTPVTVAAADIRTFSISHIGQVPFLTPGAAATSSPDVTFLDYRYSGASTTFPNSTYTDSYFVEPLFVPDGPYWPIGVGGIVTFIEQAATPTNPTASNQILTYCKGDKIVYAFNNAGTMRYKSLDMAAAGVTWVDHGSTPP